MNAVIANAPLSENEQIREFAQILAENGKDEQQRLFSALLGDAAGIEQYLLNANRQLEELRRELAAMREIQNHPMKTALQNAVKALEAQIAKAMELLGQLKQAIVEGATKAIAAFKSHGTIALDDAMSYFKVEDKLNALGKTLDAGMANSVQAVQKIDTLSREYHSAGQHLSNFRLTLFGKTADAEAKDVGKLAKMLMLPAKAFGASLKSAKRAVNAALDGVDKSRVSALGEMARLQKQLDTQERTAPERTTPEHTKKRNEEER